jgi:pentatricopeptide repeat protein
VPNYANANEGCRFTDNYHRNLFKIHSSKQRSSISTVSDDLFFTSNLLSPLVQCRDVDQAQQLFSAIGAKTKSMYGAMCKGPFSILEQSMTDRFIQLGYISNGMPAKVLELFDQMSVEPHAVIITLLFNACAKLADANAVQRGKDMLKHLPSSCFDDQILINSAIDMLMRFGDVEHAERLFSRLQKKNIYTYGAMINGYKLNNEPRKGLRLFDQLKKQKIMLDEATSVSVVGICSQIGLISRCRHVLQHIPAHLQSSRRFKTVSIDMWVSVLVFHRPRSPIKQDVRIRAKQVPSIKPNTSFNRSLHLMSSPTTP